MDIEAMTPYYGAELAQKMARCNGADVADVMSPVVADRCDFNPFYITAVLRQASKSGTPVSHEKTLDSA